MLTPARWHIRKRYTYDRSTNEWTVAELTREFDFDAGLLVDAEFEQLPRKHIWDETLASAKDAEDPEEVLEDQLTLTRQLYHDGFEEAPEDHLEEMLAVLEAAFRQRAGMD